jgi:AAA+ ATPase superfamily predicted ATPase
MKNIIGPPVYGENFINREKEIARATFLMEDGNSFLLLGIRRTGKSSLLKEIARRKEQNGWQAVFVNCSNCKTSVQFYRELYTAMPKDLQVKMQDWIVNSKSLPPRLLEWITNLFDKVNHTSDELQFHNNWDTYSSELAQVVSDFFQKEQKVALFLDELPFFFQNLGLSEQSIKEVQSTLTTLRVWRDNGLPMGIAGSLNIHIQLDNLGVSRKLLAGLNTLPVEPFTRVAAEKLINNLVSSKKYDWWTPQFTEKILELLTDYETVLKSVSNIQ